MRVQSGEGPPKRTTTYTTVRKRCRRLRIDPAAHPMLQPAGPVDQRDLTALRVREHLAFEAVTQWQATRVDLRDLLVSAAVARALAGLGYGADELPMLDTADDVLATAKRLSRSAMPIGVTFVGAGVLRWLLTFHDQQRDAATARHYHVALHRVAGDPGQFGVFLA